MKKLCRIDWDAGSIWILSFFIGWYEKQIKDHMDSISNDHVAFNIFKSAIVWEIHLAVVLSKSRWNQKRIPPHTKLTGDVSPKPEIYIEESCIYTIYQAQWTNIKLSAGTQGCFSFSTKKRTRIGPRTEKNSNRDFLKVFAFWHAKTTLALFSLNIKYWKGQHQLPFTRERSLVSVLVKHKSTNHISGLEYPSKSFLHLLKTTEKMQPDSFDEGTRVQCLYSGTLKNLISAFKINSPPARKRT